MFKIVKIIIQGADHGDRGSGQAEEDGGELRSQGQEEERAKDEAVEDEGNVERGQCLERTRASPMLRKAEEQPPPSPASIDIVQFGPFFELSS